MTDVNDSGEQTIFRKAVKNYYDNNTKNIVTQSHSFSAETINSKSSRPLVMKAVQDTSRSDTFYYGDTMYVRFFSYSKDTDGKTTEIELVNETNPAGFSVFFEQRTEYLFKQHDHR